jgi:hypothetical protein
MIICVFKYNIVIAFNANCHHIFNVCVLLVFNRCYNVSNITEIDYEINSKFDKDFFCTTFVTITVISCPPNSVINPTFPIFGIP